MRKYVTLRDVCKKESSNIAQKDIENSNGTYAIYGAGGYIKDVNFYHQDKPYIAVVKDGAGIGRTMLLPGKTSVIGTLQYLIPNDSISDKYLYYALTYMNLSKYFTGATIPHIYFKDYQNELLPLPPMEKQQKIAGNLEKIDTMIGVCNSIMEKMDVLVQSRFVEMFGDPESNDMKLPVVKMGELFTIGSSKRIYQNEQTKSGVPFFRIADLTEIIETGNNVPSLYISEERYKNLKQNGYVPNPGDILVTARGTLGSCYIVKKTDKFYFQDGMISWMYNMRQDVSANYIYYLFHMPEFRKQFDSTIAGSTVSYLSIAMLKKLEVLLPPLSAQNDFAAFVREIDKSKLTVQKSLEKLEILKKSLMQQYFGQEGTEKWEK